MRIAISGSHRVGKSTLVDALARRLTGYAVIDEPYVEMVEDGHVFAHPPTADDFSAQLEHSLAAVCGAPPDALLDRCPIDLLAYLAAAGSEEAASADVPSDVADAMERLDLVVYVPIEAPDRISFSPADDPVRSRRRVDEHLRAILRDDMPGLGLDVLEVRGRLDDRVESVLHRIREVRSR